MVFKPRLGAIEGAYRGVSCDLVVLREASLPDVCIVCGTPANGGTYRAEFQPFRYPSWHIPFFYDIAYLILGRSYVVNFPFCSICTDDNFDIQATWLNEKFGFFTGVSRAFLKLLPGIPLELAAELEGTWKQKLLRSLMR